MTDSIGQDIVILHQVTLQDWMPHLCSWNFSVYMNTYGYSRSSAASLFLKSHCAWTHTVWIRLLYWDVIIYDWWRHSVCLAAYHNCSWLCYSFAVDHTYVLQLRDVIGHITLEECFTLKHCHFIKWHHWCHCQKQCSSFVTNFMSWDKIIGQDCWPSSSSFSTSDATTPLSPTFIFFSDYNFNIYLHPPTTTSTTVLL